MPRIADHPIASTFTDRWSPRAFSDQTVSEQQLLTLFEAARWAPSAFNMQPWRFIYARRDTPYWNSLLELLVPANQAWANKAAALVFIVSKTDYQSPGKAPVPFASHAFDSGAAWMSLALQANKQGLITHAMGGFDHERARSILKVPDNYALQAAVAIGYQGDAQQLPQALQEREQPSQRLPLSELIHEGAFT